MKKIIKETSIVISVLSLCIVSYFICIKFAFFKSITPSYNLSSTTQSLVKQFTSPIHITLHSTDIDKQHHAKMLIARYQLLNNHIQFNLQSSASLSTMQHALILNYQNQQQILNLDTNPLDENHLTQALFKLQRKTNQWTIFLQGHGEKSPFGTAPDDFKLFSLALVNQGLKIQTLNLHTTPFVAENTQLLVIAAPKTGFLPQEAHLLTDYIDQGKDILWLIDADSAPLPFLNQHLGISPLPGIIIDLHGQKLGTPHPALTLIEHYPSLPFSPPSSLCIFPFGVALEQKLANFSVNPLLLTDKNTYLAANLSATKVDATLHGPLLLGVVLTKAHPKDKKKEQRIAIIGNSAFLSNRLVEQHGNLAFGLNLFNWLNHDDALIHLEQPLAQDRLVQIHLTTAIIIQYGFPMLAFLIFSGNLWYFYKRKHHSNTLLSKIFR